MKENTVTPAGAVKASAGTQAAGAGAQTPAAAGAAKASTKAMGVKDGKGFRAFVVVMMILILGLSGTAFGLSMVNYARGNKEITVNYGGGDGNAANFVEGSIADVAAKVSPSVVSIVTEIRTTSWFGTSSATSAGTGMIVTADGYILTNKHVVEGAKTISVILDDGTKYEKAKLVGMDALNDVAFLKVEAENLPAVTLGDSKTISAGQQVIAIGNALGQYQNTITSGIISGTGRSLTAYSSDMSSSENLTDMIQTDAAINAGNSGGPLVNAAGEVIGINTATSTDADGIGFAIPISSVKGMLKNVLAKGKVERAYVGVYSEDLTPDVAAEYDLSVSAGAYVTMCFGLVSPDQRPSTASGCGVIEGSPAEKAGIEMGDVITKVNGIAIGKAGSLSTLIGEYAPGDTIQLTILRGEEEKVLTVTLEAYKKR